eukprot:SAG31_NODE_2677_length_5265_cov_15.265196_4_plen_175_part_00
MLTRLRPAHAQILAFMLLHNAVLASSDPAARTPCTSWQLPGRFWLGSSGRFDTSVSSISRPSVMCWLLRAVISNSPESSKYLADSITFGVWWAILVPAIYILLKDAKQKKAFTAFNTSPLLVNVHMLNFVFAAIDFFASPLAFTYWDLWLACTWGLCYLVLYILVFVSGSIVVH